jgi:GNAT superfamily N-acetyltransferase
MPLCFEYLADRPDDVSRVMFWWYSVWAANMGPDLERYEREFRQTLGRKDLPLDIVAIHQGNMVGTAALKGHEMVEVYPLYRFWLGSVFVAPEYRGRGIATRIAQQVIRLAEQHRIPHLHLQTVDLSGGLYAALGWDPLHQLIYRGKETLVMVKPLNRRSNTQRNVNR